MSVNLDAHSFYNDTELSVVARDPGFARGTRLALCSQHLERPVTEIDGDLHRVVDELSTRALARVAQGAATVACDSGTGTPRGNDKQVGMLRFMRGRVRAGRVRGSSQARSPL